MLLQSSKYEKVIWLVREAISEIFKVSLISYLLAYLIENFKAGFIADYFNLNILLWLTIISGVLSVWIKGDEVEKKKEPQKIKVRDYVFIVLLGLASMALIYYKIKTIGWLAYLIAPISGVIVILLSILLLNDESEEKE
jgi:hypothetical protein